MTWMNRKSRLKDVVQGAARAKMLTGTRLILSEDVHDTDQVHIYEPLIGGEAVKHMGTIIKDALSDELASMLGENTAVIVEFNIIGIAPSGEQTLRG